MNVIHIITNLESGGAQRALFLLLESDVTSDAPFTHTVLYFHEGPYVAKLRALGVRVERVVGFFGVYDPTIVWRLYRRVKLLRPSIIHTSLWLAGVLGRLVGRALGVPVLCDVHSDVAYHGWLRNGIDRLTARGAQYCAVAAHLKHSFEKHIDTSVEIAVIPNGIDVDAVIRAAREHNVSRVSLGVPENAFVIGSVGRLVAIKRYEELLWCHAVIKQQCPEKIVRTCIVGSGPDKQALQAQAQALGIKEEVLFLGHRDDVYGVYPLFDCFVQSSQSEGLSFAILEALCFGLPIVVSSQEKHHEVVVNNEHGFVVPASHGGAGLAQAVIKLMLFEKRYCGIKHKNIALVRHDYARSSMVARYHALYLHHGT